MVLMMALSNVHGTKRHKDVLLPITPRLLRFFWFIFWVFRYERFEVLAIFSSTVLVMFGALFIVKER